MKISLLSFRTFSVGLVALLVILVAVIRTFGSGGGDASGLQKAFSAVGAPFSVLDLDSAAARRVYGFDYLLVRPDLHVVWRGNALPNAPDKIARIVTGHWEPH